MKSTLLYKVLIVTLFDLLFIILFLAAVSALLSATWFTLRRQFNRARRILSRLFVCSITYMTLVIVTSLILPRQVMKLEDLQCFDDMCVSVDGFSRMPEGTSVKYAVDMRLSNSARRVTQRENNLVMYLTDAQGRRYDPMPGSSSTPYNVLLAPQESIVVSRSFLVPTDAAGLAAVITHEGGFPIGWFIIGYDTWFRKPPLIKLE